MTGEADRLSIAAAVVVGGLDELGNYPIDAARRLCQRSPVVDLNIDPLTYELAYAEGVRAVEAQAESLTGARDRAGTLLAVAAIVGAVVVQAPTRNAPTVVAVVALFAAACLAMWVLLPVGGMRTTTNTHELLSLYVESVPPATLAETHRSLAYYMQIDWRNNETKLIQRNYALLVAAGLILVETLFGLIGLAQV